MSGVRIVTIETLNARMGHTETRQTIDERRDLAIRISCMDGQTTLYEVWECVRWTGGGSDIRVLPALQKAKPCSPCANRRITVIGPVSIRGCPTVTQSLGSPMTLIPGSEGLKARRAEYPHIHSENITFHSTPHTTILIFLFFYKKHKTSAERALAPTANHPDWVTCLLVIMVAVSQIRCLMPLKHL